MSELDIHATFVPNPCQIDGFSNLNSIKLAWLKISTCLAWFGVESKKNIPVGEACLPVDCKKEDRRN